MRDPLDCREICSDARRFPWGEHFPRQVKSVSHPLAQPELFLSGFVDSNHEFQNIMDQLIVIVSTKRNNSADIHDSVFAFVIRRHFKQNFVQA